MTLKAVGIGLLMTGAAGLLFVPLTHSGLGSCGPYGAFGFMTLVGPLLVIAGVLILVVKLAIWLFRTKNHRFRKVS